MTETEEYDEAQAGEACDESMTGPGAPTPLSALEVSFFFLFGLCGQKYAPDLASFTYTRL